MAGDPEVAVAVDHHGVGRALILGIRVELDFAGLGIDGNDLQARRGKRDPDAPIFAYDAAVGIGLIDGRRKFREGFAGDVEAADFVGAKADLAEPQVSRVMVEENGVGNRLHAGRDGILADGGLQYGRGYGRVTDLFLRGRLRLGAKILAIADRNIFRGPLPERLTPRDSNCAAGACRRACWEGSSAIRRRSYRGGAGPR